jgi:multicomponent Na+:H+ antiporter subunit G
MSTVINLLDMTGIFFCCCGVLGILRMPDIYCRLQTSTKNVTLGSLAIYLAIMLQQGVSVFSFKVFLIALFILITNPIASQSLMRASLQSGLKLTEKSCCNDYPGGKDDV